MASKQVKVYLYDDKSISGGYIGGNGKSYKFYPKDLCIVEPVNSQKKKHRGRAGQLTGKMNASGKVGIRFLDTWTIGYVEPVDLVPYKPRNNILQET